MKKIFAILALAITGTAFAADSFFIESQRNNNVGGVAQQTYQLGIRKDLTSTITGDIGFANAVTNGTNALGTRLEAGISGAVAKVGPVTLGLRGSIGERFSNTTNFSYYAIEPSVSTAVPGVAGLSAKVGWRYRSATASENNDQTHTMRYTLAYALTKVDTVSVRYDRVEGDSNQKTVAVSYARGF